MNETFWIKVIDLNKNLESFCQMMHHLTWNNDTIMSTVVTFAWKHCDWNSNKNHPGDTNYYARYLQILEALVSIPDQYQSDRIRMVLGHTHSEHECVELIRKRKEEEREKIIAQQNESKSREDDNDNYSSNNNNNQSLPTATVVASTNSNQQEEDEIVTAEIVNDPATEDNNNMPYAHVINPEEKIDDDETIINQGMLIRAHRNRTRHPKWSASSIRWIIRMACCSNKFHQVLVSLPLVYKDVDRRYSDYFYRKF